MRSIYNLTMNELVEQYNKATADKGIAPVKKFTDLKTGQNRLFAVIKAEEVDLPEPEATNVVPLRPKKEKPAPTTKPITKKVTAPSKEKKDVDEFGVRVGSNRNKLFNLLKKTPGKPVQIAKCIEAVYGKGQGSLGALAGVIKGCEETAPHGKGKVTRDGKGESMTLTLTLK